MFAVFGDFRLGIYESYHVGAPLQPKIAGSGDAAGGGRELGASLGMHACRSCMRISYKLGVCSLFSAGYEPI